MKKWWKKLKRRLESISRGNQTVFYLTWSVLLSFGIWMRLGCPLPSKEMEFRRMERTHLLPRSEIVLSYGTRSGDGLQVSREDGSVLALDGTELYLRGRWMAGVLEDKAVVACLSGNGRYIRSFHLNSGPSLVPLLWRGEYLDNVGYWVAHGPGKTPEGNPAYVYNYHNFAPFLLLNAPEEVSSAEITVRLEGEECSGGGWQLKDGIWLLGIEREQQLDKWATGGTAYILRLFREDGSLLLEREGVL